MLFTIPFVIDDRDVFSSTFLTGSGPIVGFRPGLTSTLVSVHVDRWVSQVGGELTVESVTRFVERTLGER